MDGVILGIDVGGTFTDLAAYDPATGRLWAAKVPTTPDNQARGALDAIAKAGVALGDTRRIVHGTTVGTNAVLEGKGARVAVLTTRGFRDVLEIGRGNRPKLYDLKFIPRPPLVARPYRVEVDERTLADGTIEGAVTREAVADAVRHLPGSPSEVEAWAVCFLHAYRDGTNERLAEEYLRQMVSAGYVSRSGAIGEYREYERFSTTVLNAMVSPSIDRYLDNLEARLVGAGYGHPLLVMQSSGGTVTARTTRQMPAVTMLSGPAGGVQGALFVARAAGLPNVITCDMGGTSTDVCLVKAYRAPTTHRGTIAGHPTRLPQIEINTVGAGGGSIASVDVGPRLAVGPASAGARPGPACYANGGTDATVTDANLVLGRLGGGGRLAGEIGLDPELARAAVGVVGAGMGGLGLEETAEGIIRLALVKMAGAIREISVQRGEDPRDFVLMAYGGAGPLVASELARELGIEHVLVPPYPGNLSALGLLASPLRQDLVRTLVVPLNVLDDAALGRQLAELLAEARRLLVEEGVDEDRIGVEGGCELRYLGQAYALFVPTDPARPDRGALADEFHRQHQAVYGHSEARDTVELVSLRVSAFGPTVEPPIRSADAADRPSPAPRECRSVYFGGRRYDAAVYGRDALRPDARVEGPAIVEEMGSTTCLWPGDRLRVDAWGNLQLGVGRDGGGA